MSYLSVKTREDDSLLARLRVTSDNLKHSLMRMREVPLSSRTALKHKVPPPPIPRSLFSGDCSLQVHIPVSVSLAGKWHRSRCPPPSPERDHNSLYNAAQLDGR